MEPLQTNQEAVAVAMPIGSKWKPDQSDA